MKKFPPLLVMVLFIISCSSAFQPPPRGYEVYQNRHTNDEQIKQDMRECGFPDVNDEFEYFHANKNAYTQSTICMEKKGYVNGSGKAGICSIDSFKSTEACQQYLNKVQK
ncbi:MAG: hypothetical protein Q4D05_08125 [Acinetobacter sp.]|nr:hypothetical protein [Acinetobacter sp.]